MDGKKARISTLLVFVCFTACKAQFYAVLSHNQLLSPDQNVIFDQVLENPANEYDETTGKFTAQSEGNYLIAVNFVSGPDDALGLWLVKFNAAGNVLSNPGSGFARQGSGSMLAIVPMRTGDQVGVRRWNTGAGTQTIQQNVSSFLGYKLA